MLWLLANLLPAQFFLRGSFADGAMQLVLVLVSPEAAATESAACVLAIPAFLAAYTCCGRRREPDAREPILSTSVASTAGFSLLYGPCRLWCLLLLLLRRCC